jgi:hypothetical protein
VIDDGTVPGAAPDPPLGAYWRDNESPPEGPEGKANCAAAVSGRPIAPNTRATSTQLAPKRHPIPLMVPGF